MELLVDVLGVPAAGRLVAVLHVVHSERRPLVVQFDIQEPELNQRRIEQAYSGWPVWMVAKLLLTWIWNFLSSCLPGQYWVTHFLGKKLLLT